MEYFHAESFTSSRWINPGGYLGHLPNLKQMESLCNITHHTTTECPKDGLP